MKTYWKRIKRGKRVCYNLTFDADTKSMLDISLTLGRGNQWYLHSDALDIINIIVGTDIDEAKQVAELVIIDKLETLQEIITECVNSLKKIL